MRESSIEGFRKSGQRDREPPREASVSKGKRCNAGVGVGIGTFLRKSAKGTLGLASIMNERN